MTNISILIMRVFISLGATILLSRMFKPDLHPVAIVGIAAVLVVLAYLKEAAKYGKGK